LPHSKDKYVEAHDTDVKNLKGGEFFLLVVALGLTVTRFVSVAIHEILGHGLAAELLGGSFYAFYLSPGSGFASTYLPPSSSIWSEAFMEMSGVGIEVLLGSFLLLSYPRIKTYIGRLLTLLFVEVLMVYSLLYLALGSFDFTGGDSSKIANLFTGLDVSFRFLLVGLLWATVLSYVISKKLLILLAEQDVQSKNRVFYLLLFWFLPPLIGVLSGIFAFNTLSKPLSIYLALFASSAAVIFGFCILKASKSHITSARILRKGRVAPLIVAFLLILPLWFFVFGPTEGSAQGLLIKEPPIEAEKQYANPLAINLKIIITSNLTLHLEFRFKGIPDPESPLMKAIWATYENRADFDYYQRMAVSLSSRIFNVSKWNLLHSYIQGKLWALGEEYDNARVVMLDTDPQNNSKLMKAANSGYIITAHDPFLYQPIGPGEGFLDSLNMTWERGISMMNFSAIGGASYPYLGENYLLWRNMSPQEAHHTYSLEFKRT